MSDPLKAVDKALASHSRALSAERRTLAELHAAILAALDSGTRQSELVRRTGYTRERIRQLDIARGRPSRSPDR